MMKADFFKIVKDVSAFFLWYKDIGVEYIDISEESLNKIMSWGINGLETSDKYSVNSNKPQHKIRERQVSSIAVKIAVNKPSPNNSPSTNIEKKVDHIDCKGDINAKIFFIGEIFNYTDPTGDLFLKILKAMNLNRDDICLCTFSPLEYKLGIPMLRQQVADIRDQIAKCITEVKRKTNGWNPQIICTFGDSALKIMMGREYMLSNSRGQFQRYNGIALIPTYHPSQIIVDTNLKRPVWEDMKKIMSIIK